MSEIKKENAEKVEELLGTSKIAFQNGQLNYAFKLAKEAAGLDPKCAEAYQYAADVCMCFERYDDAESYYRKALECEPDKGIRYFSLAYVQATANKVKDALENFAKADELGLDSDTAAKMYHIMGIIDHELGKLDDALINLNKSDCLIPGDTDVMERKLAIYGIQGDIVNCLSVANQMKLVAPSKYSGYRAAYIALKNAGRMGDAVKELGYARRNLRKQPVELMIDMVDCFVHENRNDDALYYIKNYMKGEKPDCSDVVECYLTAAELFMAKQDFENALKCVKGAESPADSYNSGIFYDDDFVADEFSDKDICRILESEREIYRKMSIEELEALRNGNEIYFTPIPEEEIQAHKLSADSYEETSETRDRINHFYLRIYDEQNEYRLIMRYAVELQKSEDSSLAMIGLYMETRAMKYLEIDGWRENYEKIQKKFRNAALRNPDDVNAVVLRVKCFIDTERYEEAESLSDCLREEIRSQMLEDIAKARGESGKNGSSDE